MTKVKTSTLRKKDEDDARLFITGTVGSAKVDLAGSDGEAESDDERAHNNLMSDIGKLSKKKRIRAAPRSVRFSTREGGTKVNTKDILKRIGIPELEKGAKKLTTLSVPLEKVAVKRAKRVAGYDKVACESEKWAGLVHKRRAEEQLSFPLQQPDLRLYTAIKSDAKMRSDLEKEVYALLQGAKLVEDKQETNEIKERKRAMSLEELKERNRMLWREREQRRRIQRKAWMQNKNKSRKFHRLLRKDRLKKQRAELEELQKANPEAALEKLEELERARVHERMTLRHKYSKWAHLQGMRVTRDETARNALKENKNMHQDLVAKRKMDDSSSDEEDEEMLKAKLESLRKERQDAIEAGLFDPSNPWTANLLRQVPGRAEVTPEAAIDDSFINFKRFWDEVNRRRLIEKKALEAVAEKERQAQINEEGNDDDGEVEDHSDESIEETEGNNEKKVEESGNEMNGEAEKTEGKVTGKRKKIDKVKDSLQVGGTSNDKIDSEADNAEGDSKTPKKTKAKKKQKKQKNVDGNLKTSTKDTKKQKRAKKDKDKKDDNDAGNLEMSKTEGKKSAGKKEQIKKKEKTKKKGKKTAGKDDKQDRKSEETGDQHKKENGTENKTDSKEGEDVEDLEDHLVSIDNMFSRAEIGIQKKLKRKLEKLGINAKRKEWTVVKSKKRQKKMESSLPKIEEFEFTARNQDNIDEGLEHVRTLEDIDNLQQRSEDKNELQKAVEVLKMDGKSKEGDATSDKGPQQKGSGTNSQSDKKAPSKAAKLDPSKFLQVDAKVLKAAMPDTISRGVGLDDDEDDEEENADDVIQQAFADDYLVDEFKSAKDEAIERDKPKSLSLVLPGWGDWTGPNIQVSKRKKRRFTVNMPKPPPRKDNTMGNVIYNEKADLHSNLRKAMVSELPYPFSRVQDFEASVRAPVGRMFVPEKQHQKLTMPPVVTKMGAVIEPMTEEELIKNKDLYQDQQKRAEKLAESKRKSAERKRKRKFGNRAKRQKVSD